MSHSNKTILVNGISELVEKYDAFIFDQWGVLHDGNTTYPGVSEVLHRLNELEKPVVILTNSSKTGEINERRLSDSFSVNRELYHSLISSAEVMMNMIQSDEFSVGTPVRQALVVAEGNDAKIVEDSSIRLVNDAENADVVILLSVDPLQDAASHNNWISEASFKNIPLVCCSADQMTVTPNGVYTGLAAVTSEYRKQGGKVINFGKPEAYVYYLCEAALNGISRDKVLTIGDQLWSDVYGAKKFGFHAGLVCTGAAEKHFSQTKSLTEMTDELNLPNQDKSSIPDWLMPSLQW